MGFMASPSFWSFSRRFSSDWRSSHHAAEKVYPHLMQ
jgi:hypothetical protein